MPHPAGLGGELPPELVAAIEARVRELPNTVDSVDHWVAYLHRRMAIMFGMPPERWAYTLLHLAEYNGGRLPGLVDPGLSTRDLKDGVHGLYAHEHAVVQEFILHAMYWVMSHAPIEVPAAADAGAWQPPESERAEPERPRARPPTILCGSRLDDKRDLAVLLAQPFAGEEVSGSGSDGDGVAAAL